jgi:DNA modification methylase
MTTKTHDSKTKIEHVSIDKLIPYARNSRTHSDAQVAQIAASIKEFGFTNPVLVDGDGGIIAGHGRVMAAKSMKMDTVPCIRLDHLTEAQKKAYVIADNKLALNAGWNDQMLGLELADLQGLGFDLELTGFSKDELASLMAPEPTDGHTDEDEVPGIPEQPKSQRGDVWLLGEHRLMCGDSTQADDLAKLMDGDKADLVWTDPPYNVDMTGKNEYLASVGKARKDTENFGIKNDKMSSQDFKKFMQAVYKRYFENMRDGAVIYVAHPEHERIIFVESMLEAGLKLSEVLIWVKQSGTLSRQDFNWKHEPILYGWKEGAGHYFCKDFTLTTVIDDDLDIDKMKKDELVAMLKQIKEQMPTTIVRHDRPTKSDLHPTMKPVGLVQRMVEWSSMDGWIVLDLFGGSGSTLIACQKANRKARLMELDPKFVDVIVKRWQDFTGKIATHAETGKPFAEVKNDNKN